MATVSSHLLDGSNGKHAAGVKITLSKTAADERRTLIFESQTDDGGRLLEILKNESVDTEASYELLVNTGDYWLSHKAGGARQNICEQILFRFRMPDAQARYHIPFIISPNNYSVWWSEPE